MNAVTDRIARNIANDIGARPEQVTATVALLDGGDTVPFVARYRKEVTGGLDDTQLRRRDAARGACHGPREQGKRGGGREIL